MSAMNGVDYIPLRRRDRLAVAEPLGRDEARLKSFLMSRCGLSELDSEVGIELLRGALRLPRQVISAAGVVEYRGREIGGAEPDKVYKILRSPAALSAAAASAPRGLRVFDGHVADDHDDDGQIGDATVGCVEGGVSFNGRSLLATIIINRKPAIQKIKAGALKAVSISYRILDLDMTGGAFADEPYDGAIRELEILHLALVDNSRAGEATEISYPNAGENP
jgi:hypothetical protein